MTGNDDPTMPEWFRLTPLALRLGVALVDNAEAQGIDFDTATSALWAAALLSPYVADMDEEALTTFVLAVRQRLMAILAQRRALPGTSN